MPTPIRLHSVPVGPENTDDGRQFVAYPLHGDVLAVDIRTPEGNKHISISQAQLADALSTLPGWTAKYVRPIDVPKYIGAVVERVSMSTGHTERYVRIAHDDETSLPWVSSTHGTARSNDDIAAVLANGGYERQPEFPRNYTD